MDIRVIRSARRRKTIQARKYQDTIEILAPAHASDEDLKPHIDKLLKRIERHEQARHLSDQDLEARARQLNHDYFEGRLRWHSIRWTTNQNHCHGSCTSGHQTIRISHRLSKMPRFVLDYVLVHELAHLLEPNHSKAFWQWVNRYPRTERARGYLMAVGMEADE